MGFGRRDSIQPLDGLTRPDLGGTAPDMADLGSHKPKTVSVIPETLKELGEVFFPIPPREKGWNYAHHLDQNRFPADDEVFNAYLEAGWGYGIACAGDLAVLDVDDLYYLDAITDELPETAWQWSGSREGVHLFYYVTGLEKRINLHYNIVYDALDWCVETGLMEEHIAEEVKDIIVPVKGWSHVGEVKCDPHGYVVGPGSTHPSGNKYGPLNGDKIATISEEEFRAAISSFIKPEIPEQTQYKNIDYKEYEEEQTTRYPFYELSADDVLPNLSPDDRIGHPVAAHGSTTNANFMKNSDRETFTCWHCQYGSGPGCGLNGTQYLAVKATNLDCEDVRRLWKGDNTIHYHAWVQAVKDGLVGYEQIPYKVLHGFAIKYELINPEDRLSGGLYRDAASVLRWEVEEMLR